ncbi:MAG TPA: hypothetical protein VFB36_16445, partial [Nevskiaceae bacterium]|nr:hypothetical protein [Nevskiaceae bacterium]
MTLGLRAFVAAGLAVSLFGCGGGGGSSGTPGTSVQPPSGGSVDSTQHGQFVDAPVSGLNYRTATHQALTGAQGQFDYAKGESIQFFIGDLALGGVVPAASVITPVEVAGGNRAQGINVAANNIAWLLQSLDADCNDANGIQISDAIRTATTGRAIDFTLPTAVFAAANSPAAQLVSQAGPSCRQSRTLSVDAARIALATQLASLTAPTSGDACTSSQWCAGSAKQTISPTAAEVGGMTEHRLQPAPDVTQYFHLGGFGLGPFEETKFANALIPSFDQRACGPDGVPGLGGECVSNPPARRPYHCPGYAADCDESQKQRTYVRTLYLKQGSNEIVFLTIDAIGAGNIIMNGMKKAVADALGISVDNVLTGATHSHAGADLQGLWGGVPEQWVAELYQNAAAAAVAAKNNARAATLTYATGQELAFNSYRRPRIDPNAITDKTLSVLQAKDSNGAV